MTDSGSILKEEITSGDKAHLAGPRVAHRRAVLKKYFPAAGCACRQQNIASAGVGDRADAVHHDIVRNCDVEAPHTCKRDGA